MNTPMSPATPLEDVVEPIEREHILNVLRAAKGNKREAARLLKISRGTLYRRLKAYGLHHLVRQPLDGL